MDRKLITSVLGFDLKIEVKDENGEPIKTGVRSTYYPPQPPINITYRLFDKSFITSFNEELLAKIRQHRRLID